VEKSNFTLARPFIIPFWLPYFGLAAKKCGFLATSDFLMCLSIGNQVARQTSISTVSLEMMCSSTSEGTMLRSLMLAGVAVTALIGVAGAADITPRYTKAPPVAVPYSDWSGFYAGVSLGYYSLGGSFGDPETHYFNNPDVGVARRGEGGLLGAQIGYNWQFDKIVAGLEVEGLANLGSAMQSGPGDFEGCGGAPRFIGDQKGSVTAKGRLGYLVMPSTLLYGTAGWSAAGFRQDHYDCDLRGSNNDLYTGWTAGGGIEQKVTERTSLRLEGRFTQYGSKTWIDQSNETFSMHPETWTATLGANFKF
jgi:outer membrane immunogenic protein